MSFSLYEATVPTMIQLLAAGQGWIEKAMASDIADEDIAALKLSEDMLPFAYQAKSMVVHSIGAIEGVRQGSFSPDMSEPATDLEQIRLDLGAAENALRALSKTEVDGFVGGETHFLFPPKKIDLPFASEDFLLSFSQPNFYFHATTTYALLRMKGLDIGKLDYMGPLRMKAG